MTVENIESPAEEPEEKKYKRSLMGLIGSRPIAYYSLLARALGGVKCGVMVSQLLYWSQDKTVKSRDGWIIKSVEDMEEETGLTKLEQQTARAILTRAGVIEAILRGVPRIWHYRVNTESVLETITDKSHWVAKPSNGLATQYQMGKPSNDGRGNQPILGGEKTQLNKVLETTDSRLPIKTTSSSYEEETTFNLSPRVLDALNQIGVFKNLHPEISRAGFSDDVILEMIDGATKQQPEPGQAAALFIYRLRNTPLTSTMAMSQEDRERAERHRYLESLKNFGLS